MATHSSDLARLWQYFATLYKQRSSGQLLWGEPDSGVIFHFDHGRLIWSSSEVHHHRRWQRAIKSLNLATQITEKMDELTISLIHQGVEHWGYQVLVQGVSEGHLSLNQARSVAQRLLQEQLFTLPGIRKTKWVSEKALVFSGESLLPMSNLRSAIEEVVGWRQEWLAQGLQTHLADQALKLRDSADSASTRPGGSTLFNLGPILNGQRTFWDVVLKMKLSTSSITRLIQHFYSHGVLDFVPLPDLPGPDRQANQKRPLILCVDDSIAVCDLVKTVVTAAGHDFLGCQDPLAAVALAIAHKPALVFLDLVMPVATGYEVCAQLRRVSSLANLPVVILTSNTGAIDRIRAKLVKATAFLGKPIKPDELARVMATYISPTAPTAPPVPTLEPSLEPSEPSGLVQATSVQATSFNPGLKPESPTIANKANSKENSKESSKPNTREAQMVLPDGDTTDSTNLSVVRVIQPQNLSHYQVATYALDG